MPSPTRGRAPKTLRLHDLDPVAFAGEVMSLVGTRAGALQIELGARPTPTLGSCPLVTAAMWLGWWAKTGDGDAEQAATALARIEAALFSRPIDKGPPVVELDATTPIGIILAAARARLHLARGEDVPVKELAALAGTDASLIRRKAGKGVLGRGTPPAQGRTMDAGILYEDAVAWLARGSAR